MFVVPDKCFSVLWLLPVRRDHSRPSVSISLVNWAPPHLAWKSDLMIGTLFFTLVSHSDF